MPRVPAASEPMPAGAYAEGARCCDALLFERAVVVGGGGGGGSGIAALNKVQWVILFLLNAIGPFSSDAYLPAMPQIQCELATSSEWTSLTIQINWIVLGLMNPVVGILSDKFGRKNLIYASMAVFATGSIGCALSTSIAELMIARIVMGVGQAVSIITFAMVRDLIDDQDERMQLMAFFNMMQPMMLLGAPTIGGFIVGFSSWRVLFWLLAGWGALLAVMVGLLIPETGSEAVPSTQASVAQSNPAADSSCCNKTHRLFDNGTYVVLTITAGLFMAGVRTMLATVTFIYSAYYCTTSQEVGILIALPTFAGFLSGNLAGRLSGKKAILKTPALLRYGMAGGLVAPASLVLFGMFLVQDGWWATTFPCAMMSATGFFCLPAMQVLILDPYKDMSGFAGGLSKMFMTFISAGTSMVVSYFYNTDSGGADSTGCGAGVAIHCPDPHLPDPKYFLFALAGVLGACEVVFWVLWAVPYSCSSKTAERTYAAARKVSADRNENEAITAAEKLFTPGGSSRRTDGLVEVQRLEGLDGSPRSESSGFGGAARLTPTSAGFSTSGSRV